MPLRIYIGFFAIFIFALSQLSVASVDCKEGEPDCVEIGSWSASLAVGAGIRENPIAGRDDIPLIFLPAVSYHGERFSLDNLNLSYLLAESERHSFHLLITPSLEYMFFNDWSVGSFSFESGSSGDLIPVADSAGEFTDDDTVGTPAEPSPPDVVAEQPVSRIETLNTDDLHDRNLVFLGGAEYGVYIGPLYLGLQALQDIGGAHKGQELRFAGSYQAQFADSRIRVSAGALWKSASTMDYYYGIRENEVENPEWAYQADAGISYFTRLSWSKKLSEHWSITSAAYFRRMSAEAFDSPLVDKKNIASFYFGGVYHF